MEARLLSKRNGMEVRFIPQPDGTFLIEHFQDVEADLDHNKALMGMDDPHERRKAQGSTAVHAAHIPDIIVVKWLNEDGLNVFDPDHAPRLRKKLNDPDWAYLRTTPGRL